jgi:hypothetical protein
VLSLWGALSDVRSGLSPVSHCHPVLLLCDVSSRVLYQPLNIYVQVTLRHIVIEEVAYETRQIKSSIRKGIISRVFDILTKPDTILNSMT